LLPRALRRGASYHFPPLPTTEYIIDFLWLACLSSDPPVPVNRHGVAGLGAALFAGTTHTIHRHGANAGSFAVKLAGEWEYQWRHNNGWQALVSPVYTTQHLNSVPTSQPPP